MNRRQVESRVVSDTNYAGTRRRKSPPRGLNISDFDYELPDERIAKFPLPERDASKLLVWRGGRISQTRFDSIGSFLPHGSLLVFNNTRVVRARLTMFKVGTPTAISIASGQFGAKQPDAKKLDAKKGARIEILCLEPHTPADYEHAFAAKGSCEWLCMVGNSKKWKSGPLEITYTHNGAEHKLSAHRVGDNYGEQTVRFEWDGDLTFGELLDTLGRIPIPPYLNRDSDETDNTRYQTVYARHEGSVAAPTAGLHFTPELISGLTNISTDEVTLHVGAGTFLPVKTENALDHPMHTEHFEVALATIEHILSKLRSGGPVIAVGTTSVRTLESLAALGYRIAGTTPKTPAGGAQTGDPDPEHPVGQFELQGVPDDLDGIAALQTLADHLRTSGLDRLRASTRIMISPGFRFRIVGGIITNFHQPKSTLLLLVSAFVGGNGSNTGSNKTNDNGNGSNSEWRRIYDYALSHDFRFLSYGDSSLLLR